MGEKLRNFEKTKQLRETMLKQLAGWTDGQMDGRKQQETVIGEGVRAVIDVQQRRQIAYCCADRVSHHQCGVVTLRK